MSRVTFKDIADKVQVSASTVSIVLNGQRGVNDKTRDKVLSAAHELGYVRKPLPDSGHKGCVRLVIYQKHGLVVDKTPFFNALFDGIGQACRALGVPLQIHYVHEKDSNEQYVFEQLNRDKELGVILLATEMTQEDVARWIKAVSRLVVLDNYFGVLKVDTVAIDNEEGAYEAVHYLVGKGYTDIGYLHSSVWVNNLREREIGVHRCLEDAGLTLGTVIPLESTLGGARRDMAKYLDNHGKVSRAVFADNDIIAVGAMQSLLERGYHIPQDVELVGFDDMPYSQLSSPPISTCRVYKHQIGQTAVEKLMQLRRGEDDVHQKIRFATKFISR